MYLVRVWDTPTRLFHWLLVGLVVFSFVTAKIGITAMRYHEWSGFTILVLVVFRLFWGFFGGRQSRFTEFLRGPAVVFRYVSSSFAKDSGRHLGHNPLGGWSIIAMLASLVTQAGTGMFANDDILTEGPLYGLVSKGTSDWLTGIHHLNAKVLLALIVVHIGAVVFYLAVKHENLIKPMIFGTKLWEENIESPSGHPALAFCIAAAVAATLYITIY